MCKRTSFKNRGLETISTTGNRRFERNNRNLFNLKTRRQKIFVHLFFKKNVRNKNQVQYL